MKFAPPATIDPSGRLKTVASGTSEVFKLDPRIISRDPGFNPREDFGDIISLSENILANGMLDPLKVRKEGAKIFLVNGDRRLTAVAALIEQGLWPEDPANQGFPMPVPCTSEGKGVKPLDRRFMMLSLNTGKPFSILEKGMAYLAIIAENPDIKAAEIARRGGETKQAVGNALCLVREAHPDLLGYVRCGTITATTALEIIKGSGSHAEQLSKAIAAIENATTNGRRHATPKDIQAPPEPEIQEQETPPYIAPDPNVADDEESEDLNDDEDEDEDGSPADPGAFSRLTSAPSTHRDGSSGAGPAPGFSSLDDRIKKMEALMDSIDADVCSAKKWNTAEVILDYFQGNRSISDIREFLTA